MSRVSQQTALALSLAVATLSITPGCARDRSRPMSGVVASPAPAATSAGSPTPNPGPDAVSGAEPATATEWASAFPHVRVNVDRRLVEVEARVSGLVDPTGEGRVFYLEQIACLAGTKDHESLLVTDARPSHVHAALLLIGLEPGRPVYWTYPEGRTVVHAAEGDALDVRVVVNGRDASDALRPTLWAQDRDSGAPFDAEGGWVFAGSTERVSWGTAYYEADVAGTLIGLASFGSETVSWSEPISHEEADGELGWIANLEAMPPADTPVVVLLGPPDVFD